MAAQSECTKTTGLYILNGRDVWYVNYISVKAVKPKSWRGVGGMNWETGTDIYTLLCIR